MGLLQKDRTAALKAPRLQAAEIGRVATAPIEDSPIPGAVATLCLSGPADAGGAPAWLSQTPLASLVNDLVAASGGIYVGANGPVMTVRFAAIHGACIAARRLQWAVQGLAEAAPAAPLALTILVHAGEDLASGSEPPKPPKNHAGKILVAGSASKSLDPAFNTRTVAQGFTELVWRAPDEQTTRAADERALARFSPDATVAPPIPQGPVQPAPTTHFEAPNLPKSSTSTAPESAPAPRRSSLIWAAGLAAVLLIGGSVFYFTRGSKSATGQVAQTSSVPPAQQGTTSASQPPAITPAVKPNQPQAVPSKSREKNKPQAENPAPTPAPQETHRAEPPPPEAPRGDCQYAQDQIPALLGRAESSRARGQYADARRLFTAVLACDRGNRRAEDGLQQVIQAIKAGSGASEE